MRTLLLTLAFTVFTVFTAPAAFGWGQTGHRAIGYIAQQHLTPEAQARLTEILEGHSLAAASTWMDEIRSDDAYDYTSTWHWVTIPDGMAYAETEKNPNGDALGKIKEFIAALEEGTLSAEEERNAVRFLVHLIGDIHQPLHVGTGEDRGGNDFTVIWFGEPSNLHRVWDSSMIDQKQLSFTELARFVMAPATDSQIADWQRSTPEEWAQESMTYRDQLYDVPQDREIGYEYSYRNFDAVQQRLLQAGVRLAAVFNAIYG
jgi:hypothetical protein